MEEYDWNDYRVERRSYYVTKVSAQPGFAYRQHTHRGHHEIVFVSEGSFLHSVNSRSFFHRTHQAFFVCERDLHALRGDRFTYFNVAFPCEFYKNFCSLTYFGSSQDVSYASAARFPKLVSFTSSQAATIVRLCEEMTIRYQPELFVQFLSLYLRCAMSSNQTEVLPGGMMFTGDRRLDRTFHTIEDIPLWLCELLQNVSTSERIPAIDEFVKLSTKSHAHLSRTFQKHFLMSPVQYLNAMKLARASKLIQETNLSIQEIIERLEFASPHYFYALFKKNFGTSPLRYRNGRATTTHVRIYP